MAEPKTRRNDGDVEAFLSTVDNDRRRTDAFTMNEIMTRLSGSDPKMWGSSIVGFGEYSYTNRSGKQVSWMKTGFSPRKQALTLYIMDGFDSYEPLLDDLGPHSTGKSCLYIKDLSEVDQTVLEQLITASLTHIDSKAELP